MYSSAHLFSKCASAGSIKHIAKKVLMEVVLAIKLSGWKEKLCALLPQRRKGKDQQINIQDGHPSH